MSFAGDLRGIGLADVFQNLAANRATGTLDVRSKQHERFVRVEAGAVTGFSFGVGKGLAIVEHLIERRLVDGDEVERVLARHRRTRKPPVVVLVERGLVDDATLTDAIAERMQEGFFELFGLRDAEFRFEQGEAPARVFDADLDRFAIRLEIEPLLMEAARRRDELERVQRVVGSLDDHFVLLEGYEAVADTDTLQRVAPELDGRRSVGDVIRATGLSAFVVRKAIHDLVLAGVARPSSAEELVATADAAQAEGRTDDALRCLAQALRLAHGDHALRLRHAAMLRDAGRLADAAIELARVGHDAARAGDLDAAIEQYRAAIALQPEELPLQERLIELLAQRGDEASLTPAVLELCARLRAMGLAERARTLLSGLVHARASRVPAELVTTLADVESDLGHWQESSRLYRALGERVVRRDELAGLTYLRAALRQDPHNEELAALVADLESGRAAKSRARRRRFAVASAALIALAAAGVTTLGEMTAARRASAALGDALGEVHDGRAIAALARLDAVRTDFGWTPSGKAASAWVDRLVDLHLDATRGLIAAGAYDPALGLCEQLAQSVVRADLAPTLDALRARIEREREALAVLQRVDRDDVPPSAVDLAALETLARPEHLEFLVAHLSRVRQSAARVALLDALAALDSPRAVVPAVAAALASPDGGTLAAALRVLARVPQWRSAGREPEWRDAELALEEALEDPARAALARRLLTLLRGPLPAAPQDGG